MTTAPTPAQRISYGRIFALAWPASVASSVTPLLGAVDVWALAHSARPLDVAAIGLGSVIFSLAYWSFGFIRMSVAGLTAQAVGAENETEARASLVRGASIGAGIGLLLVLLQAPLGFFSFKALAVDSQASAQTFETAKTYFAIRIWGAPFALATYAAFGWFSARERTDYLMIVSVAMTLLNVVLDYLFVVHFNFGAAGVATGTLIAEVAGFFGCALFIALMLKNNGGLKNHWRIAEFWKAEKIRKTVSVNRDIFIRTFILAFSFAWFVQRSGAFGDIAIAANQTLLQLFLFTGLALDGTAIAAETLIGQAMGARDKSAELEHYKLAVRRTFELATIAALVFVLVYWIGGDWLTGLLTPEGALRDATREYMPWVIISPLIVVVGFQLDGIFIGATRAKEMRDSMLISAPVYIIATLWLGEKFGNHGLWAAFSLYFVMRALTLGVYLPRLQQGFTDQR